MRRKPSTRDRSPRATSHPLRVAILGRRQLCGDCLANLFERYLGGTESRTVTSGDQVRTAFGSGRKAHVVVYSAICPYSLDLAGLRELCATVAPVPVLVHVDLLEANFIRQILEAGAKGVLPTSLPPRLATAVLQLVAAGETYVPAAESAPPAAGTERAGPASAYGVLSRLTPRQVDVLRLITLGKSNKEIGRALGLGQNTIKFHVATLMSKLRVDNRVRLAVMASRVLPP